MKTLYIGIDPDLRTLNCALLLDDYPTRTLLAVFLRRNKTKQIGDGAVSNAVKLAALLVDDVIEYLIGHPEYQNCDIKLIAESQSMQHQRHSKRRIDPDDILHLGQVVGILMGSFCGIVDGITLIQPSKWKKQMTKKIHHPRILNHLKIPYKKLTTTIYPECYKAISMYSDDKVNPGDFEDINDSIGLALYGANNKL